MKQMILEITAGASFDAMPEALQKAIQKAKVSWPQSMLVGSQPIDGKQLILIMSGIESAELETWMNEAYPSGELDENGKEVMINFDLGWKVLAEEGKKFTQSPILAYMLPIVTYDDNGEIVSEKAVTSLRGCLQTFSGRKWTI